MKRHCGESVPAIFKKKFRHADLSKQNPFPVNKSLNADLEKEYTYIGFFTGMSVEIFDDRMIRKIFDEGCYGKGSMSRSAPKLFNKKYANDENMVNQRQYTKRQEWKEKFPNDLYVSLDKVIVVPDEVNIERYMEDLKKSENTQQVDERLFEKLDDPYSIPETLILFLEEAFFLHDTLECLQIRDTSDVILQTSDILEKFCEIKPNFMTCLVAYLYLKKKNWVIKSGMKFGGDYLLYNKGPKYYHASYIVHVQEKIENEKSDDCMSTSDFKGYFRIAETSSKELLILDVIYPSDIKPTDHQKCLLNLSRIKCVEICSNRIVLNQEKDKDTE